MTNIDKLNKIFCEVFNVDGWDSVRQLSLTSSLEDTFDIMLDPEDIISCNSYEAAKSMLSKYEIEL